MDTILIEANNYSKAVELLLDNKIVVIPTETVYGIGAKAVSDTACATIYTVKKRPLDNPLIVHCGSIAMAEQCLDTTHPSSTRALELLTAIGAGPLTVVAKASSYISQVALAGLSTVAIRIPKHTVFTNIIALLGYAVVAPSANQSGKPSATDPLMAWEAMAHKVPAIVDGGVCNLGLESTIVDCTTNPMRVLRYGSMDTTTLQSYNIVTDISAAKDTPKRVTPGSKYKHYAPACKVIPTHSYNELVQILESKQLQTDNESSLHTTAVCLVGSNITAEDMTKSAIYGLQYALFRHYPTWEALSPYLYTLFAEVDRIACTHLYIMCPTQEEQPTLYDRIIRASNS